MLQKKKIVQFGHETLRQVAAEIDLANSDPEFIKQVATELRDSIPEHGIGLAAPQINHSIRMFLADISKEKWTDDPISTKICINPKIISWGTKEVPDWEGCLSAPGLWGQVIRPYEVEVEYRTIDGTLVTDTLRGVAARVFQHEIDHLDGILFVDRMVDMKTLITDEEFDKIREEVRD